ncbi:MAG: dienelactone hydrolase family protein [Planctomycetales bacterium]|nr:dienelactone hydrolase family protein [Planctomycetales bacterium]
MTRLLSILAVISVNALAVAGDSLPPLSAAPQSVEQLWAGYDPRSEPLEARVVREWQEDGVTLRYVTYAIGAFRGKPARMAAFYGFPTDGTKLPAVMHMHGGGQRAFLQIVKQYAKRGYATLSVNWGGRPMEGAQPDDPNTDWGAVDPTQNNVGGYSNLLPRDNTIDPFPSARNNNWFLLTVGCRRGITFLEQQPEVDANRIGVFGHSMGGRLTGLVAGSDQRVKAASPSVGGSGFLQTDLWGLPGSARRVQGDLALFQRTIAGQAYLARIRCPILYLSATNDFNAPMDFVEKGMALVPHENQRTTYAPHLNHRFTPEAEIARPLWFDSQLQNRFEFPKSPSAELALERDNGIPIFRVSPDKSLPIDRVDVYYGYERDPRNRFWADGGATVRGGVWEAECPVFDLDEPLFAFANVYYRLSEGQRREGDPETFALSVFRAAYPDALREAKVKPTEQPQRLIDDFARGFHDWYTLNINNRHHWLVATRKLADPRWEAPRGATLSFEIETTAAGNTLAVELKTDSWRNYSGRKPDTWTALVPLAKSGRQRVALAANAFANPSGKTLDDWHGITELIFQSGAKSETPSSTRLAPWSGEVPRFFDLRWAGGEPVQRRKPFLSSSRAAGGLDGDEFQQAIKDSIRREKIDHEPSRRNQKDR